MRHGRGIIKIDVIQGYRPVKIDKHHNRHFILSNDSPDFLVSQNGNFSYGHLWKNLLGCFVNFYRPISYSLLNDIAAYKKACLGFFLSINHVSKPDAHRNLNEGFQAFTCMP